ncbi:hypothetical protein pb186bvf_013867 [Paramecium bursaria]
MYFGYNTFAHSSNLSHSQSLLRESQVITLQKESENYIRRVELEKKHAYGIDEAWQTTKKEWLQKQEQLKKIQFEKSLPQTKLQQSKIKNLQNQLDQSILKYNETQTQNSNLKHQIEMLRKERAQYLNIHQFLQEELLRIEKETVEIDKEMEKDQTRANLNREQIAQLKVKNDSEKEVYVEQFDRLKQQVLEEKKRHEQSNLAQRKEKPVNIDTGSILKQRLKKIIANNKEKVRLIEMYQKNMRVIEDAFNQIKESSGIVDIEEIMNTFIKSEEQNYSLYNYVDILSQQIDSLQDNNVDLRKKIELQERDNLAKKRILQATPAAERHRKKNDLVIESKQKDIKNLRQQMDEIAPSLKDMLMELSQTKFATDKTAYLDYKLSFNLNESSLEKYLQDLERYIDLAVAKDKIAMNQSISQTTLLLDEIPTKDFKTAIKPQFNEDELLKQEAAIKVTTELLSQKQLRELAIQSLIKKK